MSADAEGQIVRWNVRAEQMFGWSAAEALGQTMAELIVPEDRREAHRRGFEHVLRAGGSELAGQPIELEALRRDGSLLPIELTLSYSELDGARTINAFIRDVSQRRQAHEALAASERRLAEAQALAHVGSYEWDIDRDVISWSDEMCALFGIAPEQGPRTTPEYLALMHPADRDRLAQRLEDIRSEVDSDSEHEITLPDGTRRWVHARRRRLPGPGHRVAGTVHDVTDRRHAEDARREAEEHFQQAFEYAPIGMALVALDGTWLRVNRALCELIGYEPSQLAGMTFQEITHPHDLATDLRYVQQLLDGQRASYQMDKRYLHADGQVVPIQLNASLIRDQAGRPLHFIAQILDISERKAYERELQERDAERDAAEAELRQSEARHRTLVEQMPSSAVVLVDRHLRIQYTRGPLYDEVGVDPEQFVGQPVRHAPGGQEAGAWFEALHQRALDGESVETQMLSERTGRTYMLRIAPVRGDDDVITGAMSVALDITARVEAQAALEASEERYRLISERSTDLVARYDGEGRFLWASPSWSRLGYEAEDLVGADAFAMVHPDDREPAREVVGALRPGAWEPLVWIGRFATSDGGWMWVESILRGYGDPATGALEEIQCTLRDITARVQADSERDKAQAALAVAEERNRTVIDQLTEGIVLQDRDSRILSCNAAAERILGLTADEICGRTSLDPRWQTVYEDGSPRPGSELPAPTALRTGQPVLDEVVGVHKPDGSVSWIQESVTLLRHHGDVQPYAAVASFSDITAQREQRGILERERRDLQEAQAVARIGSWDYDLANDRPGQWSAELWRMLDLKPRPCAPELEEFLAMVNLDDRERVGMRFQQALLDQRPFTEEFGMRSADGRQLHVAFRAEVPLDECGKAISAYGTLQDVTDRAQRDAEQVALREIAELVADGAGPAAVFGEVANQVRVLMGAEAGAISRFDAAAGQGSVVSGFDEAGRDMAGAAFQLDGISASAMVFRTGRPARVDTPKPSPTDPAAALVAQQGFTAMAAAPIIVAGQRWGALGVAYAGQPVPADVELRLERFTRLVAMAIANADAWDTLARQAATDPLTGLANHRTFHDRLRSEVQRARRYERDLTVVLFDLDHFKDVNDTHGHQAGDRVLAEVARRLGEQAREGELVARIGGEEFAWLMPETSPDGAYQAADRARRAIEAAPFDGVGTVTVSVGICATENGLDGDDLVRFADRALYWAKDGGRNTTFLYTREAHALLARDTRSTERFQTMSSVRALARAIDSKDPSTRQHSERVASLAERLALQLGWTTKRARQLHACGLLHDVGKIGIPDELLLKPGPLTAAEYEQIKRHAEMSAHIAAEVLEDEQVTWIRGHHERWDGTGYPDRMAADRISDGAQILALADAWDVMTENRTYKTTKTHEQAIAECQQQAGRQFAPTAVEALVTVTSTFRSNHAPPRPHARIGVATPPLRPT